ncbi:predicted protein [Botrytis cinerea T4]|uniref:Uncharacterized protein n=1 Tax=Botryotinia fuckeliana (strain T4) TaxID=999810 RepID=G2YGF3_BOTF4|nr:predicted protein [Botrytis cinerea T4]
MALAETSNNGQRGSTAKEYCSVGNEKPSSLFDHTIERM